MFADYFSSNYSSDVYTDDSYPYCIDYFDIKDPIIDNEIVNNCLRSLKPSYLPGPDNIPSSILKTFCDSLTSPLPLLFNLSIQSGCFINAWKTSFIQPLHKSGNKADIANYRGITKLSAIPKLFEQVLTVQISFNLQRCVSPSQHGFLKGKSTVTNLLYFVSIVLEGFSKGLRTDTLYTDLHKAFDYGANHAKSNTFQKKFSNRSSFFLHGRSMGKKKSVKFLAPKSTGFLRYRVPKFWVLARGAHA